MLINGEISDAIEKMERRLVERLKDLDIAMFDANIIKTEERIATTVTALNGLYKLKKNQCRS